MQHSVDVNWVKEVRASGKAAVSISYDYFPLDVPMVISDHAHGVELACNELKKQGCSNIAFSENLKITIYEKEYIKTLKSEGSDGEINRNCY